MNLLVVLSLIALGWSLYRLSDIPKLELLPEPVSMQFPVKTWVAKTRALLIPVPVLVVGISLAHTTTIFTAIRLSVFLIFLIVCFWLDAAYYTTPDWLTVPSFLWAIGAAVIALLLSDQSTMFPPPYPALIGACVGAGTLAIIAWLGEVLLRKPAMGFGDITMAAVIGAHLGEAIRVWVTLLVAIIGGVAFSLPWLALVTQLRKHRGEPAGSFLPLPFAVFLAPATAVTLFFDEMIIGWILLPFK